MKALVTLSVMSVLGKKLLDPIFYFVAKSSSHEAFLSIILTTVLLMSFVTQGSYEPELFSIILVSISYEAPRSSLSFHLFLFYFFLPLSIRHRSFKHPWGFPRWTAAS